MAASRTAMDPHKTINETSRRRVEALEKEFEELTQIVANTPDPGSSAPRTNDAHVWTAGLVSHLQLIQTIRDMMQNAVAMLDAYVYTSLTEQLEKACNGTGKFLMQLELYEQFLQWQLIVRGTYNTHRSPDTNSEYLERLGIDYLLNELHDLLGYGDEKMRDSWRKNQDLSLATIYKFHPDADFGKFSKALCEWATAQEFTQRPQLDRKPEKQDPGSTSIEFAYFSELCHRICAAEADVCAASSYNDWKYLEDHKLLSPGETPDSIVTPYSLARISRPLHLAKTEHLAELLAPTRNQLGMSHGMRLRENEMHLRERVLHLDASYGIGIGEDAEVRYHHFLSDKAACRVFFGSESDLLTPEIQAAERKLNFVSAWRRFQSVRDSSDFFRLNAAWALKLARSHDAQGAAEAMQGVEEALIHD